MAWWADGDGDGAAGVELLDLVLQPGLAVFAGLAPGVEVCSQVLVGGPGRQDRVCDLEQGVLDCHDGFLARGGVLWLAKAAYQPAEAGLQPAFDRIADHAACTSIGLM